LGQVEQPGFRAGADTAGSKKYMIRTIKDNNASQRIICLLADNLLCALGTHTSIRVVVENRRGKTVHEVDVVYLATEGTAQLLVVDVDDFTGQGHTLVTRQADMLVAVTATAAALSTNHRVDRHLGKAKVTGRHLQGHNPGLLAKPNPF
jgi:hypothetical protein